MSRTERAGLPVAALWLLAFVLQLLMWFPWGPQVVEVGLDGSYAYALNEFFVDQTQFADLVHSHGPYGFLKNSVYHPKTFCSLIGYRLALFAVFALLAARLASRWTADVRWGALWIVLLVTTSRYGDAYFSVFAVLTFLVFWSSELPEERMRWSPAMLALSLASLMKFSYMMMIVAMIGLMALVVLVELLTGRRASQSQGPARRVAVAFAWPTLFLVGLLSLWIGAGQDPARLGEFLVKCWRFTAHYSESHAIAGPVYQVVSFVAAGCALWTVFVLTEIRRSGARALAPALALGFWLWLTAKYSFVRHDTGHSIVGTFQGLSVAVTFGLTMLRRSGEDVVTFRRGPPLAAVGLMAAASLTLVNPDPSNMYGARVFSHLDVIRTVRNMNELIRGTFRIEARNEGAMRSIRKSRPLPHVGGTVDVYPWELSLAFAHHLQLQPRPSVQSHSVDAPLLAAENARHLESSTGPDYVLLRVGTIDRRYPTSDDGLSWPVLLADFRLRSEAGSHLLLKRVQGLRVVEWGEPTAREARFGERLELPNGSDRLVWLRLDLVRTNLGDVVSAAARGPIVFISVELAAGEERWYRLVPGAARAGFLLSPLVSDNRDFVALHDGRWPERLAADRVRALTLHTEFGDGWYWEPTVHVEFREMAVL
jgi:hypothetical protein